MGMISERDAKAIREHFERNISGPVRIDYFTQPESRIFLPGRQDNGTCKETGELLAELSGMSDKISLSVHDVTKDAAGVEKDGIQRVPAFILSGAAKGKVRYFGIPSGYEFSALLEDLADVSSGDASLSEKTIESLGTLAQDVHIQVFATPT